MFNSLVFSTLIGILGPVWCLPPLSLLGSGCSTAGPASCQNDTAVPNLCCFESPGVRSSLSLTLGHLRLCFRVYDAKSSRSTLLACYVVSRWSFITSCRTLIRLLGQKIVGPYMVSHLQHSIQYLIHPSCPGLWSDKYVCFDCF
jgi:hypothetical protein